MSSPSLEIRRLVVTGSLGCNLSFTEGVNVVAAAHDSVDVRLQNTSGKTTLIELIRCGFGRQYRGYADFPELEQLRSSVKDLWLEVWINGTPLLIERSLESLTGLMKLRWCVFEEKDSVNNAQEIAPSELSAILLDRLGIPDVSVRQADGSLTKLTFPLLQRAFVLHQEDSFLKVLDKVEPFSRRTQVVGFLLKTRSLESFELEPEVGDLQMKLEELRQRIHRVEGFLADNGVASLIQAESRVSEALKALASARQEQFAIQLRIRESQQSAVKDTNGKVEQLRQTLLDAQATEQVAIHQLGALRDQERDLRELLGSLEGDRKKLRRLRASSDVLSTIAFRACPRCLQRVTEEMQQREGYGRCGLCGRTLGRTSDDLPRAAPNEEDLLEQIGETTRLLEQIREDIQNSEARRQDAKRQTETLGVELDKETKAFVSPALDRLIAQAEVVAQLTAAHAKADALRQQAAALDELRTRAARINEQWLRATGRLAALRVASADRVRELRDELGRILQAVQFPNLQSVDIEETTLMPTINGHSYEGEGTGLRGVVVVCYHLAMLSLARRLDTYFPCFLVIDSPAVGELNEVNHDALLEYIASLTNRVTDDADPRQSFQLLLTTRRMTQGLEGYVRCRLRAPDRMLLRPPE